MRARRSLAPLLALTALAACRSQPPSPDNICYGLSNDIQPPEGIQHICEPQMCMDDPQRASFGAPDHRLECGECADLTPEELSTDAAPREFRAILLGVNVPPGMTLGLGFDNRAAVEPSLAKFQEYARTASGRYDTFQGRIEFQDAPFEVLGYEAGRLKVRVYVEFGSIITDLVRVDLKYAACIYSYNAPGSPGDVAELIIDVDAPLEMHR